MLTALALALIIGGLAYHFFALTVFNALVPKDPGVETAARDVAFGPDDRQRLDVYRPSLRHGTLPIVVFVYGGSWKEGARGNYAFAGMALAAQGYVAMVADYRLVPDHLFPAFVEDAASAIAFAQAEGARFGGDVTRIYVVGHSAGGYNLAQAILDPRYLKAAGCDPCNLKAAALLAAPLDFLPLDSPATIAAFGTVADLAATQPVNYARAGAPPLLLLTGTGDTTVRPRNSRNLHQRLLAAGAQAMLKEYVGLSHAGLILALSKPLRARAPVLADITAFFAAH